MKPSTIPQFTKYTPGATDFERVILGQWNSNVAEIGTRAGGTGTLRDVRLIGAHFIVPNLVYGASGPSETFGTGEPAGTCISSSIFHRTDGAGSSLYGWKNAAWAALN